MRADRLITLLLLLQNYGKLSAKELAHKLEVSERTIHRDIDALSAAGIPIYGEPGRGGGFNLLEGYRTSLTGLSEPEVRIFFMLSIPTQLSELDFGKDLEAIRLKLLAALPSPHRVDDKYARQRLFLDSVWWRQGEEPIPHLQTIEQAVWQDHRLNITYQTLFAPKMRRLVSPYGLVAKAGVWYLVCERENRIRVYRVDELQDVHLENDSFRRPPDFDLADFWKNWCANQKVWYAGYMVTVRVAAKLIPKLPKYFGNSIRERILQAESPDEQGRITLTVSFDSLEDARARLLSFGNAIQVVEPLALRLSIEDYARQIIELYST